MSVQYMSFSAHADAKGIMQLISYCEPRHIMLVHGEAAKMDFLKGKIQKEFGEFGESGAGSGRWTCVFMGASSALLDAPKGRQI